MFIAYTNYKYIINTKRFGIIEFMSAKFSAEKFVVTC